MNTDYREHKSPAVMATISTPVKPFGVPNFVQAAAGGSFPLSQVSAATLATLCDDFRRQVFEMAGKKDPAERSES